MFFLVLIDGGERGVCTVCVCVVGGGMCTQCTHPSILMYFFTMVNLRQP